MQRLMNETPAVKGQPEHLLIILPAYAEADNLRILLPKLKATALSITPAVDIIVIDSAYPLDDTAQVCTSNGITCIPRQGGNDYGDAIRTGLREGLPADFVVMMDADGSHEPGFIRTLWEKRHDADLVIASRYVAGGKTDNPWSLVFMSRILNRFFKLALGLPVMDVSNSFRLYRGALLSNLTLTYPHFDVLEEILVKIIWGNPAKPVHVIELPYHFKQRKFGKSKRLLIMFGLQFLMALFHLRQVRNQITSSMK